MLCDSNSVSLMSIDNSSSSEPIKKFSPSKCAVNSWWEEVEAAEHRVFEEEDAVNEVIRQPIKCTATADAEKKSVATMDPQMLTFSNKIKVKDECSIINKVEPNSQFLDRSLEDNNSTAASSREITFEFLDSSNGEKYDRLVRDVKLKTPLKRRLSGDSRSNSPISFFPIKNENEHDREEADDEPEGEGYQEEGGTTSHSSVPTGRGQNKRRRYVPELETSAEILARRQKQIDYGKNTIGYDNYIQQIPRNKRLKEHPWTPPKQYKYSRRAFDGLVRAWRTKLHCFDPPNTEETNDDHVYKSSDTDDEQ